MPVLHESTGPAFQAAVVSHGDAGDGVEALTWEHSIELAPVADIQEGGEGVGEVQDKQGTDDTRDTVQVGHGGSNEEGEDPVDGA